MDWAHSNMPESAQCSWTHLLIIFDRLGDLVITACGQIPFQGLVDVCNLLISVNMIIIFKTVYLYLLRLLQNTVLHTKTIRLKNYFFPHSITLLNSWSVL